MWQAMLLQFGLGIASRVAPDVADLIVMVIKGLVVRMKESNTPVTASKVAYDLVAGIEKDYPDSKTGDQKREMVRDALCTYIRTEGGSPDNAVVNALIEQAVNLWRAKGAELAKA